MLPCGLEYKHESVTCLTTMGLVLPEITGNGLTRDCGEARWNGVLALPRVPRGMVRNGDVLVWHKKKGPSHVALVVSMDRNLTWEMWDYGTQIWSHPYVRLSNLQPSWTVHRPRLLTV